MFERTRWSAIGAAVAVSLGAGIALPSARATNTAGGGAGVVFVPVVPCRLFDTRAAAPVGPRTSPLGVGDVYTQAVTGSIGNCTIPAEATAVAMNVTTVNATATSFLTLWPADTAQPLASNLNWIANSPATPNKVDVKLSADGKIKLFNNGGTVDVLADIVGYYADHNHDDRYYTRGETDSALATLDARLSALTAAVPSTRHRDVYPGSAMHVRGLSFVPTTSISGCTSASVGSSIVRGEVPLIVPIGASIVSAEVAMTETAGAPFYQISLSTTTFDATTSTVTDRASVIAPTNSGSTRISQYELTPTAPLVIGENMSATLNVDLRGNSLNRLCSVVLTYDIAS